MTDMEGLHAVDIIWNADQEAMSYTLANALVMKGYCTIDLKMDEDALDHIFREAKSLDRAGLFKEMPMDIADGLLGQRGATRVAMLPAEDVPQGIQICDDSLTLLYHHVATQVPVLGYYARMRTTGMVFEAADIPKLEH